MADPIMIAIAVALATNAVEGLSQAGRSAFAALSRLVQRKFADDSAAGQTLSVAQADPADEACISRLSQALATAADTDSAFATDLRRLWDVLRPELVAGDVTNWISGPVSGVVVQARDVHGGITLGPPPESAFRR